MSLEDVVFNSDDISVQQANEIFSANVEHIVTRLIVLVHLHAACAEQIGDIIFAEESLRNFEATSTSKCPKNVTDTDDSITNHVMVRTEHLWSDLVEGHDLAWADLSLVNVNALPKEEPVHLFDLFTCSKDALVTPEVL